MIPCDCCSCMTVFMQYSPRRISFFQNTPDLLSLPLLLKKTTFEWTTTTTELQRTLTVSQSLFSLTGLSFYLWWKQTDSFHFRIKFMTRDKREANDDSTSILPFHSNNFFLLSLLLHLCCSFYRYLWCLPLFHSRLLSYSMMFFEDNLHLLLDSLLSHLLLVSFILSEVLFTHFILLSLVLKMCPSHFIILFCILCQRRSSRRGRDKS